MKFAYPEFLYALFAIAIPIIIHLFNFRKFKKIYFSNVSFLKEVQQETQSKSRLKHLLILLSRILAIIFLVFAFAQPFIPTGNDDVTNQNNIVGVYVDNSFSMESTGENGSLLDEAKLKAVEIVKTYNNTDKFVLLNNNFTASDQRVLNTEEVIDKIEELDISSSSTTLSDVYSRTRDVLNSNEIENKSFYVLSDFQQTVADFKNIDSDTLIKTFFTPIKANQPNNLYIDSCWFDSPTHLLYQQEKLTVIVKNNGEEDLDNIPLKLLINNKSVTPASFSIKANDKVKVTLSFQNKTSGIQQGRIELRDAPVTTDDSFYFAYKISDNINVLSINKTNEPNQLDAIYSTDSIFSYSNYSISQLDYSLINKSNLIILNDLDEITSGLSSAISSFVEQGGSLLVFPSSTIDYNSYREFLSLLNTNYYTSNDTADTKVKEINEEHPIFKNVFEGKKERNLNLPVINNHYSLSKNSVTVQNNILSLRNGAEFLTGYQLKKGTIYLASVGLSDEFSNFSMHAIFVPILYNAALLSVKNYPLFQTIGNPIAIELNKVEADNIFHIKNKNLDFIPKTKNTNNATTVFVGEEIKEAGNYELINNASKIGLAFNYNRLESDLECYSKEEIQEFIDNNTIEANLLITQNTTLKSALGKINTGATYWVWCIVLTLLFLAIETILIKLFK